MEGNNKAKLEELIEQLSANHKNIWQKILNLNPDFQQLLEVFSDAVGTLKLDPHCLNYYYITVRLVEEILRLGTLSDKEKNNEEMISAIEKLKFKNQEFEEELERQKLKKKQECGLAENWKKRIEMCRQKASEYHQEIKAKEKELEKNGLRDIYKEEAINNLNEQNKTLREEHSELKGQLDFYKNVEPTEQSLKERILQLKNEIAHLDAICGVEF